MRRTLQDEEVLSAPLRLILAALLATLVTWLLHFLPVDFGYPDGYYYQLLAKGHAEEVFKPFSYRVLNPWLVERIASLWSMSIYEAFRYLSLGWSWVFTFCLVTTLLHLRRAFAWLSLAAIFLNPFVPRLFLTSVLPDLSNAALLAIYFLLLRARMWWQSAIFLIVLYLDRESTLLLALIAVWVLWKREGRKVAALQAAGAFVGMVCSGLAAAHSHTNRHELPGILYTAGKVPWNFMRNILGLEPWSNTSKGTPLHAWELPPWMHLGGIHAVGVHSWSPSLVAFTFYSLLATFGMGVVLLWMLWRRRTGLFTRQETWLAIAGIYGLFCFVLAPVLGTGIDRLVAYAWPLFFLWLPFKMQSAIPEECFTRSRVVLLMALHSTTMSIVEPLVRLRFGWLVSHVTILGWAVLLNIGIWLVCRPFFRCADNSA